MVMHMEYQVTLPDHDFVVALQHKLISSVIGDVEVVKSRHLTNDVITYSGATYIGIRSGKDGATQQRIEHGKFRSHLDAKAMTIDQDLELKSFEFAGRSPAGIRSGIVIDCNPVVAEFREDESPATVGTKACHVLQSQYFLQLVNCSDEKCCSSFQSSYLKVAPERFLPPPIPVAHTLNGIERAKDDKDATNLLLYKNISFKNTLMPNQAKKKYPKGIPNDYSCPSVKQDVIKRHICSDCSL